MAVARRLLAFCFMALPQAKSFVPGMQRSLHFFSGRSSTSFEDRVSLASSSSDASSSSPPSSVSEQLDAIVSGGGTASVVPGEGGVYRWQSIETDFCLVPQDSSVSGLSMTKTLNRISNMAVREILLVPNDQVPLASRLPEMREDLVSTYKIRSLAPIGQPRDGDEANFRDALLYFDCVAAVVTDRFECLPAIWASVSQMSEGSFYRTSWRTFVGVLREFGYDVRQPSMKLQDKAFCLSMLDQLQLRRMPDSSSFDGAPPVGASATMQLNGLANTLERTLLYGSTQDIDNLGKSLCEGRAAFAETWADAEALKYYDALSNLVTQGLRVRYDQLSPAYSEGFQRLLDNLVEVLGTTSLGRGSRPDLLALRDFAGMLLAGDFGPGLYIFALSLNRIVFVIITR